MSKISISENGAIVTSVFNCNDEEYLMEVDRFSKVSALIARHHPKNPDQIHMLDEVDIYVGELSSLSNGLPLCKRGWTLALAINLDGILKEPKKELFIDTEKTLVFNRITGMRIY